MECAGGSQARESIGATPIAWPPVSGGLQRCFRTTRNVSATVRHTRSLLAPRLRS